MLEVDLGRYPMDDDPTEVWWAADWAIRDDSSGTEDSSEDLAELVNGIIKDVQPLLKTYSELHIEWTLTGYPPPGGTVADAIAAAGVTLPAKVPHPEGN